MPGVRRNKGMKELEKILSALDDRERQVIKLRFGLVDAHYHTLQEIGDKLSITREWVRQIEAKALGKLKAEMGYEKVRGLLVRKKKRSNVGKKKNKRPKPKTVSCLICFHRARCLTSHLRSEHGMTGKEYQAAYPGAPLFAPDLMKYLRAKGHEGMSNPWNRFEKVLKALDKDDRERVMRYALDLALGIRPDDK